MTILINYFILLSFMVLFASGLFLTLKAIKLI